MAPPTNSSAGPENSAPGTSAGRARAALAPWRGTTGVIEQIDAGIVVVDTQRDRRDIVTSALGAAGFAVRGAVSPLQAMEIAVEFPTDLVVMDAERDDVDELHRRRGFWHGGIDPRVLFVGGPHDARLSISLLEIGDDHLAAPYVAEEMVARARAILRRRVPREVSRAVVAGRWSLDLRHRVLTGGAEPVALTRTEAAVLTQLMESPGVAVSKQSLMQAAWGHDFGRGGGVVETYISYLRRKFAGVGPRIRTVRSAGYLLEAESVAPPRAGWAPQASIAV